MLAVDDVVTDGQAEAEVAGAGGLGGEEGGPDLVEVLGEDAGAVVVHEDLHRAAGAAGGDPHLGHEAGEAALLRVGERLDGVADQVGDHPAHAPRHHLHGREVGGEVLLEGYVVEAEPGPGAAPGDGGELAHELVQVGLAPLARAAASELRHALDDGVGAAPVLQHQAEVVGQDRGGVVDLGAERRIEVGIGAVKCLTDLLAAVPRELGEVEDEVERVLELVGDAGGEHAHGGHLLLQGELFLCAQHLLVALLELAGALGDAALQGGVVLLEAPVEAGVGDGDGGLGREDLEHLEPPGREGAGGEVVLQVERADRLAPVHQRHAEDGAGAARLDVGVAGVGRVAGGVAEHHALAAADGIADDGERQAPLADGDAGEHLDAHGRFAARPPHVGLGLEGQLRLVAEEQQTALRAGVLDEDADQLLEQLADDDLAGDDLGGPDDGVEIQIRGGVAAGGADRRPGRRRRPRRLGEVGELALEISHLGLGPPEAVEVVRLPQEAVGDPPAPPAEPEASGELVAERLVLYVVVGARRLDGALVEIRRGVRAPVDPRPLGLDEEVAVPEVLRRGLGPNLELGAVAVEDRPEPRLFVAGGRGQEGGREQRMEELLLAEEHRPQRVPEELLALGRALEGLGVPAVEVEDLGLEHLVVTERLEAPVGADVGEEPLLPRVAPAGVVPALRGAAQAEGGAAEGPGDVGGHQVVGALAELEQVAGVGEHLIERQPLRERAAQLVREDVPAELEIARLEASLEADARQRDGVPGVALEVEQVPHQVGAGVALLRGVAEALAQREGQRAEVVAGPAVAVGGRQEHAVAGVAERGGAVVAVAEREVDALHHGDAEERLARVVRGRDQVGEELEGDPLLGVGQQGQVDERRDLAPGPDALGEGQLLVERGREPVGRQDHAEERQRLPAGLDRLHVLGLERVLDDEQAVHLGLLERRARVLQRRRDEAVGRLEIAVEVLGLGPPLVQAEGEVVPRRPGVAAQRVHPRLEVGARGGVRGGALGPTPGLEVELGDDDALLLVEELDAEVGVIDDLEEALAPLLGGQVAQEQAADADVDRLLQRVVDERVRRLLHPVVPEAEVPDDEPGPRPLAAPELEVRGGHDQALVHGGEEVDEGVDRALLADGGQGIEVEGAADAGGEAEHLLRRLGEAAQLGHHQVDDVVWSCPWPRSGPCPSATRPASRRREARRRAGPPRAAS